MGDALLKEAYATVRARLAEAALQRDLRPAACLSALLDATATDDCVGAARGTLVLLGEPNATIAAADVIIAARAATAAAGRC